jgi:peptidoglycan/LPS O-acetylase OafA/YrhL
MSLTLPKLHGLDHLRALAIVQVFLFHYFILSGGTPVWLPDWAGFGWTGVDLFFVLSGFLIAFPLLGQVKEGQPVSLRTFFTKRFFRILPAYWAVLLLYFAVPAFPEKNGIPPLWKFLTFTQNFGLDLQHTGSFSHAWSLCVEEHFYLLLPFI